MSNTKNITSNPKPSFSMSKEIKEFEELLQTNEVYRDVLGKWGTEITRNIIKKLLASQREKVVEEILKWIWVHRTADNGETLFFKFKMKDFEKFHRHKFTIPTDAGIMCKC